MRTFFAVAAALTLTVSAFGQASQCQKSAAQATQVAQCDAASKATAWARQMKAEGIPVMKCVVGEKVTFCPLEACAIAEKTGATPAYYVADVKYADPMKAAKAWKKQLDGHLVSLTSVKYSVDGQCVGCPMTAQQMARESGKKMQYQLAAFKFDNRQTADSAIKRAKEAADGVKMVMKVGDDSFCCPTAAGEAAKSVSKPIRYVVGKQEVEMKTQAEILLVVAKIQAAQAALKETAETSA